MFAVLEFLYGTKQSAKDCNVTWMEEMKGELKFIMQCHGNTREVVEVPGSNKNSSMYCFS